MPQHISRNEAINYDQPNEEIKAGSMENIKCIECEKTVLVNNSKDTLPAVQRITIEKEVEIIEKIPSVKMRKKLFSVVNMHRTTIVWKITILQKSVTLHK